MFIDIHVHLCRMPGFPRHGKQSFATPQQLLDRYDKLEIERAVVLPVCNPECCHGVQSNEDIIEIAQNNDRFIPFCNIDPRSMTNSASAPLGDMLKYYQDKGCKGIGEVCANLAFLDPLVQNLFKGAEETEMPLTFHIAAKFGGIYGLYDDPGLPQLEESLRRFPKLKFLGHSQSFWAEMAPLKNEFDRFGYPDYPVEEEGVIPKLMRKYPNLYGDLSAGSGCNALARDRNYAISFLNEFQDRLMFGTDICAPDTPVRLVDFLLDLRNSGEISENVFYKVAKGNAIKLLNL